MLFSTFLYNNLPHGNVIYFPYSIYDYIVNILFKPKGQKYVIGSHGMHLKMGRMLKDHRLLEILLNAAVKSVLLLRKGEINNIYCHVINKEQECYIKKTFGFRTENIFFVPIMLKVTNYLTKKNKSKKLKVVHIGGMGKELQTVLNVVNMLDKKGILGEFEFYFIGETDENVEKRYKRFSNIHFLGMIDDKQKIKTLSEMDVMVVPAYETFSKAMLEGLASGLYIITSKRTASWKDLVNLGIKIAVAGEGEAHEYLAPLISLSKRKRKRKDVNPYKYINIKRTAINFDEKIVLKKMLKLFRKVIDREYKVIK